MLLQYQENTSYFNPVIKRRWLIQELSDVNLKKSICFQQKTRRFHQILAFETFFRKYEVVRLVGNFLNTFYHLSYEMELRWHFFILMEKNRY